DMEGGRSGPPKFVNASVCDKICSQVAAHATLAALFSRERSGEGQLVEVPMLESMVGFNMIEHQSGQTFDPPLGPAGYERSMVEYRRPFATADGFVCLLPYNLKQWQSFFTAMGRADMIDDPRVIDPKLRSEKVGELYELVAQLAKDWTTDDLLAALKAADIPHGAATKLGDVADDPHLQAVGFFRTFDHPSEGRIRLTAPPMSFSGTPPDIRRLPAALGEHSVEILSEAGYSEAQIARMMADGVSLDGCIENKE
ncbi:MAG: CoA transferase, partial [Proteobacteria bacterium]|nr:CoA transferase [Pseudomonadota bacterium]